MKERPIVFSAESVRAILAGTKTQTRRLCSSARWWRSVHFIAGRDDSPNDPENYGFENTDTGEWWTLRGQPHGASRELPCPYGVPGDRLWVRETWVPWPGDGTGWQVFRADLERPYEPDRWRSPIHMPRWASRITVDLTDVRVQRVQEISEEDAKAEGMRVRDTFYADEPSSDYSYCDQYRLAWDAINGKRAPWESNPWVWALTFRRLP